MGRGMNIGAVMDQLGTALSTVDKLRVVPYFPNSPSPPIAAIEWPEIDYDATYGRGSDRITIGVDVLIGIADDRSTRDRISAYLDGTGSKSIKAALDGGTYTACSSVTVKSARVDYVTAGNVTYLAVMFQVDIFGNG